MNVDPSSNEFGNVVPWDSLTDTQKQSGDWIELPDVSGEPRRASKQSALESLFRGVRTDSIARQFDANGKPR